MFSFEFHWWHNPTAAIWKRNKPPQLGKKLQLLSRNTMETAYCFQRWEKFCCLSPAEWGKLNATGKLWTLVHNACGVFCTQYGTAWPPYQPGVFYLPAMGKAVLNTTITIDYLKERWCLDLGFGLTLGVCQEFFLALPRAMGKAFSICQIRFHIYKIQTLIIRSALSFEVGRIFKAQYALVGPQKNHCVFEECPTWLHPGRGMSVCL